MPITLAASESTNQRAPYSTKGGCSRGRRKDASVDQRQKSIRGNVPFNFCCPPLWGRHPPLHYSRGEPRSPECGCCGGGASQPSRDAHAPTRLSRPAARPHRAGPPLRPVSAPPRRPAARGPRRLSARWRGSRRRRADALGGRLHAVCEQTQGRRGRPVIAAAVAAAAAIADRRERKRPGRGRCRVQEKKNTSEKKKIGGVDPRWLPPALATDTGSGRSHR